jgi:hypothetical protein
MSFQEKTMKIIETALEILAAAEDLGDVERTEQ